MNTRMIGYVSALLLLAVVFIFPGCNKPAAENTEAVAADTSAATKINENQAVAALPVIEGDKTVVFYFHGNRRCPTCKMIEQMTGEAVTENFPEQVSAGTIVMMSVDVEQEENKGYIERFKLFNSAVVLAQYKQGVEVKAIKLKDVWKLARDREQFLTYIRENLTEFISAPAQ